MTTTTAAPIHTATVTLAEPVDGESTFYFVSLDGDHYLPVTRLPMPGEHDAIRDLFAGKGSTVVPMTCAPRYIEWTAEENDGQIEWGEVT